jgi:hypothetical protein
MPPDERKYVNKIKIEQKDFRKSKNIQDSSNCLHVVRLITDSSVFNDRFFSIYDYISTELLTQ